MIFGAQATNTPERINLMSLFKVQKPSLIIEKIGLKLSKKSIIRLGFCTLNKLIRLILSSVLVACVPKIISDREI
jgi:hypothetical protein